MRKFTIQLFILAALLLPALAAAANVSYAGNYTGSYSGGDSGTWNATISSTGAISGSGVSAVDNASGTLNGQGLADGTITFGNTSIGSIYTGRVNLTTGAVSAILIMTTT